MMRACQVAWVYKGQPSWPITPFVSYKSSTVGLLSKAVGHSVERFSALSPSETRPNQTEVDLISPELATPDL
jgi:hypothetical protein